MNTDVTTPSTSGLSALSTELGITPADIFKYILKLF